MTKTRCCKSKNYLEFSFQELQNENLSLRRQLSHSTALTSRLKARLDALQLSVDELLSTAARDSCESRSLAPARPRDDIVSDIQKHLSESRSMTSSLNVSLRRKFSSPPLPLQFHSCRVRCLTSLYFRLIFIASQLHVELIISQCLFASSRVRSVRASRCFATLCEVFTPDRVELRVSAFECVLVTRSATTASRFISLFTSLAFSPSYAESIATDQQQLLQSEPAVV